MSQSQPQSQKARPFHCSRCNINLPNRTIFHEHLRSHSAGSGRSASSLSKIPKSNEANETARYIAERRKNFPTADNISKKLKSDEERQDRGDVLQTRQFGKMKEPKQMPMRSNETETNAPVITSNKPSAKATLLERLLAPDIRRERNMVLQCVRHIVNQNFYGLDQESLN